MSQPKPTCNEFQDLGDRLVRFGRALQDSSTSFGQLHRLARDCGITLRLRTVSESEINHAPAK